jgi:hypothetical protein
MRAAALVSLSVVLVIALVMAVVIAMGTGRAPQTATARS